MATRLKKLLMIGCNAGSESMPKYFKEQCHYKEFMLDDNLSNNLHNLTYVPDIIFIQIQNDKIGNNNTVAFIGDQIRALRDSGAFVINWTGDLRNTTPQWMIDFSNNVSITMFSNMRDVEYCKSIEINTGFLQQGIDTNIFNPKGESAQTADIVFLANNYGNQFPLSGYRKKVAATLKWYFKGQFKLYGHGWSGEGNVNHSQYEEAKVYRGAKIAISVSHYDVDRYFSDRLGRALCSGQMVLSHNYLGIEKDFKVGEHLDVFNDLNELVTKCQHYLDNPAERERIALNGQDYASKEYSYQNIVKQIIEIGS